MGAQPHLISIDEARRRVLAEVRPLTVERIAPSLGRVLAEPAVAEEDLPPFDASAMDGFAVADGVPATLQIEGESRAGAPFSPDPPPAARGRTRPARSCRTAPTRSSRARRPGG